MSFTEILNPTEALTRYMEEDGFAQLVKCEIVMPLYISIQFVVCFSSDKRYKFSGGRFLEANSILVICGNICLNFQLLKQTDP